MGFRTVVVFSNDCIHELKGDKQFGDKLHDAILSFSPHRRDPEYHPSFKVVEQTHCDNTALLKVEHLSAKPIAYTNWNNANPDLDLIKRAAEAMGYKVIKAPKKKDAKKVYGYFAK